jgi:hypothetical protein
VPPKQRPKILNCLMNCVACQLNELQAFPQTRSSPIGSPWSSNRLREPPPPSKFCRRQAWEASGKLWITGPNTNGSPAPVLSSIAHGSMPGMPGARVQVQLLPLPRPCPSSSFFSFFSFPSLLVVSLNRLSLTLNPSSSTLAQLLLLIPFATKIIL